MRTAERHSERSPIAHQLAAATSAPGRTVILAEARIELDDSVDRSPLGRQATDQESGGK
jgi:hypothetical protein